jgi:integrase/recombinase XerD
MATIEQRGSTWRVRWRDPDGRQRSRACPDHRTAKRLALDVAGEVAEGRRWSPRDAAPVPLLVDVLDAYLTDVRRLRSAGTARVYESRLDGFLLWAGEDATVDALSRQLLADYYASLAPGLATRRQLVAAVERAWRWAAESDAYCDDVPRPRHLEVPAPPGRPTVAPTWAEVDAVIAHAKGEPHRRLLALLRCTGLRVHQALGLAWSDVDLERGTLRVRGELGKTSVERQGRVVPLAPVLLEELAGWGVREGALVAGLKDEQAARLRTVAAWQASGQRAELWQRRPHHAFRRAFVTGLRRAGADPDAVEVLVGHSLGLRGVYTDPEALGLRDVVALVPKIVSGVVSIGSRVRSVSARARR